MQHSSTAGPLPHDPDLALVQRALRGDHTAFEVIMRRNNRVMYRAARSILRDDAEAEEAVQDAYLVAYRALPGFRAESRLSTWLVRIAVNEALQRLRKRRREAPTVAANNVIELEAVLADRHLHQPGDTPESIAMREQMRKLLERNIDELPSAYRTVFMLRAVEELTAEETAECLGIPAATVRTRFFRARRLLRKALANDIGLASQGLFTFDGERCDRIVRSVLARLS